MIPLLLLALALSAVAVTYEFSPKAHTWVDEHVLAFRDALTAHRAADAQLSAAKAATDPVVAVQHTHAATKANQTAAKETAKAGATARTDQQRTDVAQSAAEVVKREQKIADTQEQLGVGQCDVHTYKNVTSKARDALLARLHSNGMVVTGNNPWDIETNTLGVKLRAVWDPRARELKLIVTAGKGWPATCERIWERIDPIIKEITGA
jgi:hypothetical protein